MLAERVTEWTREWKREGLAEGRKEGRKEGQQELLQRLLAQRFGALPEATLVHLATADAKTLGLWAERLLDARTLDEVFRDDP